MSLAVIAVLIATGNTTIHGAEAAAALPQLHAKTRVVVSCQTWRAAPIL